MPLPPSYKCPVCPKEKQRGHIGEHVITHSLEELKPYISNIKDVIQTGVHPEVMCSGHSYVLCINTKQGFEKGFIKHRRHVCTHNYSNWISSIDKTTSVVNDLNLLSIQEVVNICKTNKIRGYSQKKKEDIIALILKHLTEKKNTK